MPEILTEKEMIGFLDRLPEGKFLDLRNKAIFELLYATGLRVSELVHLKITDIDLKLVMVEHYSLIEAFYQWFYKKVTKLFAKQLQEYSEIESQLVAL